MEKINLGSGIKGLFYLIFVYGYCSSAETFAQSFPKLQSGIYWGGAAVVAVDGSHVTGSINTVIGENANAVCQFYFSGVIDGANINIQCHNFIDTEIVQGTISIQNESSFILKTHENPGCSERIADFVNEGKKMDLQTKIAFIQIRIVKSEKAFFYSQRNLQTKKKAYLVLGNEAKVTEKQNEWLKVSYGKTSGWMLNSDMVNIPISKKD